MTGDDVAVAIELAALSDPDTYTRAATPAQWARLFSVLISMPEVHILCPRPVPLGHPPTAPTLPSIDGQIEAVSAVAVTIREDYATGVVFTYLHYDDMPACVHIDVYPR